MTTTQGNEQDGGTSLRGATENSRVVAFARATTDWLHHSLLSQWVHTERRSGLAENSRLVAAMRALEGVVRHSFLYQWLTQEPDPDVIVIDLRETYTVGPIIEGLDRVGGRLAPWWRDSAYRQASVSAVAVLTARPLRAFGLALMVAVAIALGVAVPGGNPGPGTLVGLFGLFVIGALATRSNHSWQDIQVTRTYQLVAAVLVPPEPPEQQDHSSDEPVDSDGEIDTGRDH